MIKRILLAAMIALFGVIGVFAQDEDMEAVEPQLSLVISNTFDGELLENEDGTYTLTLLEPSTDYDFISVAPLDAGVYTPDLFLLIMTSVEDVTLDAVLEVDNIKMFFSLTPAENFGDEALVFAADLIDAVANDEDANVKLPDEFESAKLIVALDTVEFDAIGTALAELGLRSTKWP